MGEARTGHHLQFADGYYALMFQYNPIRQGDEEWWEVWFAPHPDMAEHYNIRDTDYTDLPDVARPLIKKVYKATWFKPLNMSPMHESWFVFCNYKGDYLSPEEKFGVPDYQQKIEHYKKENHSQKLLIIKLQNEIRKLSERPDSIKKAFLEELDRTKKVIAPPTETYRPPEGEPYG